MNAITKTEDRRHIQVSPEASGLLSVIERVAQNPEIDIERMQMLLNMRAEEEERQRRIFREDADGEAKRQWLAAFSRVQSEIGPIFRGRKNDHTRSEYADLADIEKIVAPILSRHGFSTTSVPLPCALDRHIRMRLVIGHEGGHERIYEDDFPLDDAGAQGTKNKTNIQAKGSTQTYARRYLKASALDLAFTSDRDGNSQPEQPRITDAEVDAIKDQIKAKTTVVDVTAYLQKLDKRFQIAEVRDAAKAHLAALKGGAK